MELRELLSLSLEVVTNGVLEVLLLLNHIEASQNEVSVDDIVFLELFHCFFLLLALFFDMRFALMDDCSI